jgi:hypothetical protein
VLCRSRGGRGALIGASRGLATACATLSCMDAIPAPAETEQILLTLPRAVVRRAEQIARRTRRPLELVLTEWLDRAVADLPVETLDDEELLALGEMQMSPAEQTELDALLAENSEGRLDAAGVARLDDRMRDYDRRLLRKSEALREAVARGLRGPLAA